MVFIFLGAVKAAKTAKVEYDKDKKRNAMIVPVEGSIGMMSDRANNLSSSASASAAGADTWWGTARSCPGHAYPEQHQHSPPTSHSACGAWSRERPPHQPDCVTDASASSSTPTRPVSQSSGSDLGAHILPLPAPPPQPHAEPPAPPRERPPSPPLKPDVLRPTKPAEPAPPDGSFQAALRGTTAASGPSRSTVRPTSPRRPHAREPAATAPPPADKVPVAITETDPPDDGSFAAAMRAPSRRPSRPCPVDVARPAADAACASAMPSTPLRKQSVRSRALPAGQPPVAAKTTPAECDGSFAAALRKESVRPARRKDVDCDGYFAAALRKESVRAANLPDKGVGEGTVLATQSSALAYPAGSKARARPQLKATLGRTVEVDGSGAAVVSGEVQSSLRKEGSMKRRVSRR